jgi:outer membrane receptor protein involved in Fe transport
MRKRLVARLVLVLNLLVASAVHLFGQAATASISGNVLDPSGAAVAGASITIRNTGTGLTRNLTSDAQGHYLVAELPIGDYELEAKQSGFQTVVRKGITLTVGSQPAIDLQLQVGTAEQTVNVVGEVSQVETSSAAMSSLVNTTQMRELPLNGRNVEQLILLAPGTVAYPNGNQTALVGRGLPFAISGSRPEGYGNLIDGEDCLNWWQRGCGAAVTGTSLGIEAIAEFQTLTANFGAEYRGNGAVINYATKSGSNAFHGSAYEFLRNNDLDARNFFELGSAAPFRRNQFGASVGGPIKKDKMFFFFNYEGLRQHLDQANAGFAPDANAKNGILPCPAIPAADRGQYASCSANPTGSATIPMTQRVRDILALYPNVTGTSNNGVGSFTTLGGQTADENYYLARWDWNLSSKDSLFIRYINDFGTLISVGAVPLWPTLDGSANHYVVLNERHIFSPKLVNSFSFFFTRPNTTEQQPNTYAPLQVFPGRQDVTISVTGLSPLGANFVNPFQFLQNKFTPSDDVIYTAGNHTLKFGARFRRQQINSFSYTYWNGNYTFNSLYDLMVGRPYIFTGAKDGEAYGNRNFRDIALAPYFQDDWRVNRRLTVNMGLRYEWQSNPIEVHDVLNNIVDVLHDKSYTHVPHAFKSNPAKYNFDPRVGFAYDIFGDHKTSLRGGFGLFHNPYQTYVMFSGYVGSPPFNSLNQSNPSFPIPFQGAGVSAPLPSLTFGTKYDIGTTPYQMQWNMNVQREIYRDTVLTVGYVGSRGVHLLSFKDFNPPQVTVDSNGVQHFGSVVNGVAVSNPRLNPNFGSMNLSHPSSTSRYNAMQASLNSRLSRDVQTYISYTWSHCTDFAYTYGGLGGNNGTSTWFNPYDGSRDHGNCSYDITHNLTVNAVYRLPFRGNRLVEGWQISGIESWHTGVPFTPVVGFDRALLANNFTGSLPNVVSGCDPYANQSRIRWFNAACYTLPAVGTIGNAGRNTLRAPGYTALDMNVAKDTKLTEGISMQFRAEFFNILNHTNFNVPAQGIFNTSGGINANQGTITSIIGTSRQIQFGLKLLF